MLLYWYENRGRWRRFEALVVMGSKARKSFV